MVYFLAIVFSNAQGDPGDPMIGPPPNFDIFFGDYSAYQEEVDYAQLKGRLGSALPDGYSLLPSGEALRAVIIEPEIAGEEGGYMPAFQSPIGHVDPVSGDPLGEQALPEHAGKFFQNVSQVIGDDTTVHATLVNYHYTGNSASMSPGVFVTEVYYLDDWLEDGFLRVGSLLEPKRATQPIENHSWALLEAEDAGWDASEVSRRIDYFADRDEVTVVAGLVNNFNPDFGIADPNKPHAQLIGQCYNTITVGMSNGFHTRGLTTIEGVGRMKPDIVVNPVFRVGSFAVPIVASAATFLYDAAEVLGASKDLARRPETLKAVLMAGATKHEFRDWQRSISRPLDAIYGAGELNIAHSYDILTAGRQLPSAAQTCSANGWSYQKAGALDDYYFFDVPAGTFTHFSAVLTWHRTVEDGRDGDDFGDLRSTLTDLGLILHEAEGFVIGAEVDRSNSAVDNVEHLFESDLPAGRYALRVGKISREEVDYALAWRTTQLRTPVIDPAQLSPSATEFTYQSGQTDYSYQLQSHQSLEGDWTLHETIQGKGEGRPLRWTLEGERGSPHFFRIEAFNSNPQAGP